MDVSELAGDLAVDALAAGPVPAVAQQTHVGTMGTNCIGIGVAVLRNRRGRRRVRGSGREGRLQDLGDQQRSASRGGARDVFRHQRALLQLKCVRRFDVASDGRRAAAAGEQREAVASQLRDRLGQRRVASNQLDCASQTQQRRRSC